MPLSLTLSDNQDGTGFTATIGGTGGDDVSVYYTPADRPWPGDPWGNGGTRPGDGDLAVSAPPRFYFAHARTATECTPPERIAVTDGLASVAERAQAALVAVLKLRNLDKIGEYVFGQGLFDTTGLQYPCAVVFLENQSEGEETGTNGTDDIVYPFNVGLFNTGVKRSNQEVRCWVQSVREKVSRTLRNTHLPGMTESVNVKVQGTAIISEQTITASGLAWQNYVGGFVVRATCREPRGLGT